jgi:glycine cleavage system regulatory protein
MNRQLVLTIVAKDKPGIVQDVSEAVASHNGNWLDSSMVRLGGEFAGIARVSIPAAQDAALRATLKALSGQGLVITVHDGSDSGRIDGWPAHLTVSGADHPGIVRDISSALAAGGVSIEELHTEQYPASMSGQSLFEATARVVIPDGQGVDQLRERLEKLAQDIMVDIDIQPASETDAT